MTDKKIVGYKKIQEHPDKDAIVEKLIAGDSVRKISAWLKAKWPHNKKLQVSYISLQSFRKNYLNIESEVLKDLQKERKDLQVQKRHEQQQEEVHQIHAYQLGKANYLQDSLIDYNAEILELIGNCKEGIGHLKDLNFDKGSHLNHQAISAYIGQLQGVIEMHNKMIDAQEKKAGNQLEEDFESLNRKMEILVESVKEAFNQTNPEGLFVFVSLVKEKMKEEGISE